MRLLIALLIGLIIGIAGGYTIANNMARSSAAGMPANAFEMSGCSAHVERTIAFTAPDAQDTLSVQSSGPSCSNLIANVTVRTSDGHIVFANAQRIDALMDPKVNPIAVNGLRAVLDDYAAIADGGARGVLPDWVDGSGEIASIAPYGMFTPTAENILYRRVRQANAPLLRLREGRESGFYFAYLPEIDEVEQVARYAR